MIQPADAFAPQPFLFTRGDGAMSCPLCGEENTHINDIYVAGRPREDSDVVPIHVDASGNVHEGVSLPIPNTGRRHVFSLKGSCEACSGEFTIEFMQHKGQTIVAVRQPHWESVTPLAPFAP